MSSFLAEYIVQTNKSDFRNYNNDYDYDRYNQYNDRRQERRSNKYTKSSEKMNIYKFIFTIINWIIFAVAMVLALKCATFGHILAGCCCSPFYLIYRIVYSC